MNVGFKCSLIMFTVIAMLFTTLSVKAELQVIKPAKQKRYKIDNPAISESSGLACSTLDSNLLWTHNDSGHMPIIYVMDTKGRDKGTFHLNNIEAIDWEDMDAFEYQGKHYLLIADSGDNMEILLQHQIYIIKEPRIKPAMDEPASRSAIAPEWTLSYKFKDGRSYDIESVAVDVKREKIVMLTKRHRPTIMFELPLKPEHDRQVQTALKVTELPDIKNPSALDISPDGQWMSINSYRRIHRYYRQNVSDNWHYVHSIKYKKLFQPEAMCLSQDNYYFVSSEKKSDLLRIKMKSD